MGRALHVGSRGLVAKGNSAPRLGQTALDPSEREVGRVSDIFGPVRAPYFVIKPASGVSREDLVRLAGSNIYMGEAHGKGRKSEKVSRVRKHKAGA